MSAKLSSRYLAQAGMIAGLYAGLTIALSPISYSSLQVRVSEALTVLPYLWPAAIPGVTIGCIIANVFGPFGPIDVIIGSALTLMAALITARMPKPWLAPLPPILINAVGLAFYLPAMVQAPFLGGLPHLFTFLTVAVGQGLACYGLGYPLLVVLMRRAPGQPANTG